MSAIFTAFFPCKITIRECAIMTKLRNSLIALALMMSPSLALAQATSVESINQKKILKSLNASNIVPVLKTLTGNHVGVIDGQGNHYIIATATNGLKFEIFFHGCEVPNAANYEDMKCVGLSMISTWGADSDAAKLNAAIPAFLRENPLINAGQLDDGGFYVMRYVIADYGTAQGNLLSEMANFIRISSNFANTMNQAIAN